MSLSRAFNTSVTGLRVSQTGLSTVSNNIANAEVEGYSRQRVEVTGLDPVRLGRGGAVGQGVTVGQISRAEDRFLEYQVLRDRTLRGFYVGREAAMSTVERVYTEGSEPTIGGSIDRFFNAARELSQDPSSFGSRGAFVNATREVATAFHTVVADLRQVQTAIDDRVQGEVERINQIGAQIAELNARIVADEVSGQPANNFRDRRDDLIRQLSDIVTVNPMPQADGSVTVELANRFALVQGDAAGRLETRPDPANFGRLDVELVSISGTREIITRAITGGELGGLLDMRDNVIEGNLADLDQLAFTFVEEVNAIHQAGFGLDGVNGRDIFAPLAGPVQAAAQIAIDPAIDANPLLVAAATDPASLPGDNRNLFALSDLQLTRHAALQGASFNRRFAEILHGLGTEAQANQRQAEWHRVRSEQSEALRESVAGVSIDDEMIDLTRFQKHFEANSRVMTTIDRLLDVVLQLVQ